MIPHDAVKLINNNSKVSFSIKNVLSPMTIDDFQLDSLKVTFNDNEVPKSLLEDITIKCQDKSLTISDLEDLDDRAVPVGKKFELIIPVKGMGIIPGKYIVHMSIESDTLLELTFERKIESLD